MFKRKQFTHTGTLSKLFYHEQNVKNNLKIANMSCYDVREKNREPNILKIRKGLPVVLFYVHFRWKILLLKFIFWKKVKSDSFSNIVNVIKKNKF